MLTLVEQWRVAVKAVKISVNFMVLKLVARSKLKLFSYNALNYINDNALTKYILLINFSPLIIINANERRS